MIQSLVTIEKQRSFYKGEFAYDKQIKNLFSDDSSERGVARGD